MSDTPETEALDAKIVQLLADAIKNNTPLSEMIGVVITMHVNLQKKLEHERNEARFSAEHRKHLLDGCQFHREKAEAERDQLKQELQAAHMQIDLDKKSDEERDQLRKVTDELARHLNIHQETCPGPVDSFDASGAALNNYNSLPHVIERNKAK